MVKRGYATVVADVRGTGNSTGKWEAFGKTEQNDAYQLIDWSSKQSFSDGKVGLYGVSYLGITAVLGAATQHPAIKAAFPIVPMGDAYRDILFNGGQLNSNFIPLWMSLITILGTLPIDTLVQDPITGKLMALDKLKNKDLLYPCYCSRKNVLAQSPRMGVDGPVYGGHCEGLGVFRQPEMSSHKRWFLSCYCQEPTVCCHI